MANDKKKNETPALAKDADLAKFLPKGFSIDDFDSVGGLRPICPPELNMDNPVIGIPYALLDMPVRKTDNSPWQAILVQLISSAKAMSGDDAVEVEPGKDILIPLGGNLKNNADLLAAVVDPRKVTPAIFAVTGQQNVGKPSPMWVYDVRLAFKKQQPRDGAFALFHKPATPMAAYAQGEVLDKDGKPVQRLVG